jgi:hypothetical protein
MTIRTDGRGVGRAFAERKAATNSNHQLYTDGRTIWSYGSHWPLAHWGDDGQLYFNADRYSTTTSKHRSFVISGLVSTGVARERGIYSNATGWTLNEVSRDELRAMVGAG